MAPEELDSGEPAKRIGLELSLLQRLRDAARSDIQRLSLVGSSSLDKRPAEICQHHDF